MPTKQRRTKAGSALNTAMAAHGVGNDAIADICKCHPTTISGWRYRGVNPDHVDKVAALLNVVAIDIMAANSRKHRKCAKVKVAPATMTPPKVDTTDWPIPDNSININGITYVRQSDVQEMMTYITGAMAIFDKA
jgi:hypothetical protein